MAMVIVDDIDDIHSHDRIIAIVDGENIRPTFKHWPSTGMDGYDIVV